MLPDYDYPDVNLWTCPECGRAIDIGTDEYAGDEDAVRMRMAHECAGGWVTYGG